MLYPHFIVLASLSKLRCLEVCGLISGSPILLVHLSIFVPALSCFYYYSSIELEVRDGNVSRSSFIVQDCLGDSDCCCCCCCCFSHMKLSIVLLRSVKNFAGILVGIALNLQIALVIREMQIKTNLRYHLTPVRMAKIKYTDDTLGWRGRGVRGTLLYCW